MEGGAFLFVILSSRGRLASIGGTKADPKVPLERAYGPDGLAASLFEKLRRPQAPADPAQRHHKSSAPDRSSINEMGVDAGPLPFPSRRLDPLSGFTEYEGKLNLMSTDYYASLAFQSLFGIVIAAAVVIGTMIWLIVLAFKECCCKNPVDPAEGIAEEQVKIEMKKKKTWAKFWLVFFCMAGITGGAMVWVGGFKLRRTADQFLDKGVATVDSLLGDIMNVTRAINQAKAGINIDGSQIAVAQKTADDARKVLKLLVDEVKGYVKMFNLGTTCYGAGVMGVAVFSLFFSFLHLKHLIGFSNFLVWWLCVAGWVLTGLTYIVYVFGRDLCSAYENVSDAGNVKALLPCVSDSDGQRALNSTYFAINDAVQQANLVLFQAYNATNTTQAASAAYLCNPTARNGSMFVRTSTCPYTAPLGGRNVLHSVQLWNFNTTYASLRCAINDPAGCYPQNKVPSAEFDSKAFLASLAQVFVTVAPAAEDLLTCQFVADAFYDLGGYFCLNIGDNTMTFFGGFFLYSLAFFPMFVVLVIGYNRFRPSCCEIGRGQVKADQAPEKEQGGHFVVGIAPPEQAMGGKGGGGDAQLGQYAANHGY